MTALSQVYSIVRSQKSWTCFLANVYYTIWNGTPSLPLPPIHFFSPSQTSHLTSPLTTLRKTMLCQPVTGRRWALSENLAVQPRVENKLAPEANMKPKQQAARTHRHVMRQLMVCTPLQYTESRYRDNQKVLCCSVVHHSDHAILISKHLGDASSSQHSKTSILKPL